MKIGEAVAMLRKELQLGKEESPCDPGMGACDVTMEVTALGEISQEPTGLTVRVMLHHWPHLADTSE